VLDVDAAISIGASRFSSKVPATAGVVAEETQARLVPPAPRVHFQPDGLRLAVKVPPREH
jgi:hypothetical protein